MRSAFLDSGYVIAVEVANDQHHAAALPHWQAAVGQGDLKLVTTSFVLDEIATFLSSRGKHSRAVEIGNRILQSKLVQFVEVDSALFKAGWSYFARHGDKHYSLTDCISFVVLQQQKLTVAFTFDHHFRQAGFLTEP